jgi:membrane-anchored glycerophosphoryl diester phosphodiesterase (GDPDase)
MNVGELLDATFSLYRRNFVLIAAISAVVQVPYAALTYILYQVFALSSLVRSPFAGLNINQGQSSQVTQQQLQQFFNQFGGFVVVSAVLILLGIFIVLPLAEAATTRAVSDRYLDRPTTVGASYAAAIRRLGALIVQSLILIGGLVALYAVIIGAAVGLAFLGGSAAAALVIVVLFLVAIPLMVYVYVRTSLAAPAIVLEGLSGWRGLVRSWHLVRGSFWRMFGIRLLLALITGIIEGLLVVLLSIAGTTLDANGQFIINQAATAIAAVFVGPVTYIGVTLLYYDTRIRKEGFDIEMLAKSL